MLSPGVPWIIVVILSAHGYPYYNRNYYNFNNYYRHQNPYNRYPDLELKRLKRCVNQWSPAMRTYNFMQNPSACGSSLVNDLSQITPEQLNCLMKILEGSGSCTNWPQDTNNSPPFQSGAYISPQQQLMASYQQPNRPPVLRPQAIHPSLLEGWVSDEDTNDLPAGKTRPFNQEIGPTQMRNVIQSEYTRRQNPGSLKAGSILVIVPAQDQIDEEQRSQMAQIDEEQRSQMAQHFYNAPLPVVPPPILPPHSMPPSQNAVDWNTFNILTSQNKEPSFNPPLASNIMYGTPPLMDLKPNYPNSIPEGIPSQSGDYQSSSLLKSNPPVSSNIMHAGPPEMDYKPLPAPKAKDYLLQFPNTIQGNLPKNDYQPLPIDKDISPLASNIMQETPEMTKDSPLQDPNIMQGSQPTFGNEPPALKPKDNTHLAPNIMYGKPPVMGYLPQTMSNTNPFTESNNMNGNLPFMDYNSIYHNSLSSGLSAYLQGAGSTNGPKFNSPYTQNIPNTQNVQSSLMNMNTPFMQNIPNTKPYLMNMNMNMNSGLNCGPWANAWAMGMYPYTGLCFNPYGSILGQRFDQLRAVTEAYQNVDEPEIEINQTTTCKKKGKDGKWVPCDPEDLERNLPSLYNNYGNSNPAQGIPVWGGSLDKLVPGLPSAPGGSYNQVPSYTTGTPDIDSQSGGIFSGLSTGLSYGQAVTGTPPALTQMTTPITDSMFQSGNSNSNSAYNLEANLGGMLMNGGYTTTANPYNQGLVGNYEVTSNYVSPYDPSPVEGYKPAYTDYNPSYTALSKAGEVGSEREGRIISGNMNQENLLSTDRPGQGNSPMFIPSKSIPAIPLYTGYNKMADPARTLNMMPYGQPIYVPQMISNGQNVQYPYFMSNPVAYRSNQSPDVPRWVPMKIDRTPQASSLDSSKIESLEDSNIDDTGELEETIEESNDY